MPIARPAESAYDNASPEIRGLIDQVVAELRGMPDWADRPPVLLEMVDALDLAMNEADAEDEDSDEDSGPAASAAETDEAEGEEDEDEGIEEDDLDGFAEVIAFYVGAVLEQLDEKEVTGAEQAAFYLLSCHAEHIEAAQGWLDQGDHQDRFRAFLEANPDYDAVLELVEDYYEALADQEEGRDD